MRSLGFDAVVAYAVVVGDARVTPRPTQGLECMAAIITAPRGNSPFSPYFRNTFVIVSPHPEAILLIDMKDNQVKMR